MTIVPLWFLMQETIRKWCWLLTYSTIAVLLLLSFECKYFLYILWILYTNLQVHQPPGYKNAPQNKVLYIPIPSNGIKKNIFGYKAGTSTILLWKLASIVNCLSMHECMHMHVRLINNWLSLVLGLSKHSECAFLFSLRNKNKIPPFKCPVYDQQKNKAIYCSLWNGATFGGGHDLHISSDANTNQYSCSNLGFTYQPPPGYQPGTPQTKALLAGSEKFTPTEVEVFRN